MYQELRLDQILETLRNLHSRIAERFPASGLSRVAGELVQVAEVSGPVIEKVRRPNLYLRTAVGIVIVVIVTIPIALLLFLRHMPGDIDGVGALVQTLESATQDIIFLSVAIWFLVSIEGRHKRRIALTNLHRLRSIVHIS